MYKRLDAHKYYVQVKITELSGIKSSGADVENRGPKLPPMEIILRGEDSILSYAGKLRDGRQTGKLDLGELGLRELPPAVLEITTLVSLRLDNNKLKSLPDSISQLQALRSLSLSGCSRLTALPVKMGRLTNLKALKVDGVNLVTPPKVVMQWEVEDVMDYLARFDEAEDNGLLDLVDIGLSAVPLETFVLSGLAELNLTGNHIAELPAEFARLSNVVDLRLSRNQLQTLPLFLVHFTKLNSLSIEANGMSQLPPVICMLSSLVELHCGGNKFISLPPKLGTLTNLVELDIADSKLRTPPPETLGKGTAAVLEYLARLYDSRASMTLDLSGMDLQTTPLDGSETTALTRLALSNNQLRNVPWEATEMTGLTELWLDRNHLDALPAIIGALSRLRALNVEHNHLRSLPVSIGDLQHLQVDLLPRENIVAH